MPRLRDKNAVALFGGDELGKCGAYGDVVRFAREDAAEERPGEAIGELIAEASREECTHRFVLALEPCAARDGELEPHAELRIPREELGRSDGADLGRYAEHHAFGHRVELALVRDVDLSVVRQGLDDLVREAELLHEVGRVGLGGDPRVRAAVDQEALVVHRDDVAAEPLSALQDHDVEVLRGLFERVRCGEAGDAPTHDDHALFSFHGAPGDASGARKGVITFMRARTKASSAFKDAVREKPSESASAQPRASISRS
jgi:hypothetical protein